MDPTPSVRPMPVPLTLVPREPASAPRRASGRELRHATIWLAICLVGGSLALIVNTLVISPPGALADAFPICRSIAHAIR